MKDEIKTDERVDPLSDVAIRVLLSFHAFQVFLLDENVDALLNDRNLRLKASRKLVENLSHKLCVVESFTHLHDSDDGRLDEHLTIFLDVLMSDFLLCFLLRLQREINIDAKLLAAKRKKNISKYFQAGDEGELTS